MHVNSLLCLIHAEMANHLIRFAVQQSKSKISPVFSQVRNAHHEAHDHHAVVDPVKVVIGKREVVGFGMNGSPSYLDRVDFPMPAIRYKEVTPEIQVRFEKLPFPTEDSQFPAIRCFERRRRVTGTSSPLRRRKLCTGPLFARPLPRSRHQPASGRPLLATRWSACPLLFGCTFG